jgi:hypothetical protein
MPTVTDRVFEEGGYAFFRDAWHSAEDFAQTIYVAFIAAAHSRTHKQCDDLSVLLHGYGEAWLVDLGFWSYDEDDLYQELAESPRGHNVVEVDGQGYLEALPAERDEALGLRLITSSDLGADRSTVSGEHRLNEGVLFEDSLRAEDGEDHAYVLHWHLASGKQVEQTAPGEFLVTTDQAAGPELTISVSASGSLECGITEAATDPYQGWVFPAFLQVEPAPVIHCRQEGRDLEFLTNMELRAPR